MKKFLFTTLFTFSVTATAIADTDDAQKKLVCKEISLSAVNVMEVRQQGIPITSLIDVIADDSPIKDMLTGIIYAAYDYPKMMSEENKKAVSTEFGSSIYLKCMTSRL